MNVVDLLARPIEAPAFAPYGWLVDGTVAGAMRPVNGGSSVRQDKLGTLALTAAGGMPVLAVFRASGRDMLGPWRTLERHRLGTQTFIPMTGARFVVLVALGDEAPDPATLAAFVVDGRRGITLHAGTWHHGLLALDDGDFVVLERAADAVDCDLAELPFAVRLRPA